MDDWNSILTNLIDEVEFNSKVFFFFHNYIFWNLVYKEM
jgi:hypothetical protein